MEVAWQDGGTGVSAAAFLESSLSVLPVFAWLKVFGHKQRAFQGNSSELDIFILVCLLPLQAPFALQLK